MKISHMFFISAITVLGIAFESMAMQPEWNIQDNDGDTPVHYIARFCDKRDSQAWTDAIIESHDRIDPSIKNKSGKTAEQIANEKYANTGKRRCQDIYLALSAIKSNPAIKNNLSETAGQIAKRHHPVEHSKGK